MFSKFIDDIKQEQKVVKELDFFMDEYIDAMNEADVEQIAENGRFPDEISDLLDNIEESRIKILIGWLNISRNEAVNLRLAALEKYLNSEISEHLSNINNITQGLWDMTAKLN